LLDSLLQEINELNLSAVVIILVIHI